MKTTWMPPTTQPTPFSSAAIHRRPTSPLSFGSTTAFSKPVAGMAAHQADRFLKAFDFKDLGTATLNQIKLIYGLCIVSRLYNAAQRSKNEVREVATRDTLGFSFWLFATPMIQRLFLKTLPPKEYRAALVRKAPSPVAARSFKEAVSLSLRDKLQFLNWRLNPISRYAIPSSQQVKDQMTQTLGTLEQAGKGHGSEAFAKLENYYKNILKWRNLATGAGTLITIGLLGIGINMYNIYLTNKKRAEAQGRY